jgi:phosphoglycerate kinase
MRTLKNFEVKEKRVLVRCDFNVPLAQKQGIILDSNPPITRPTRILDDFRIRQSIPTIEYLIKKGAKIILMSHLGRPEGKVVESLRLTPIQNRLMEYLDVSVTKAPDCIGQQIEKWTKEMLPGEILLLENLRFHKEEKENNEGFAKELAELGNIYINDAFGASHRAHASIVGVPKFLPSGIGFLLEKEIKVLTNLIEKPKKPLVAIIGGAKVETKSKLINKISGIADFVLLGGLITKEIKEKGIVLDFPQKIIEPLDEIEGKDIGLKTIDLFKEKIKLAKTIFFNGVVGMIEVEKYAKGTKEILKTIAESKAFSVVGGGDMTQIINRLGLIEKFNHVSTGGGALLDFIADGKLVGIEALK